MKFHKLVEKSSLLGGAVADVPPDVREKLFAAGFGVLRNNTSGNANTGFGPDALRDNTTGTGNTAIGVNALFLNTSGDSNVALGFQAGVNTTGSNNIYLGAGLLGVAGESNTMYPGKQGTQTTTYIAGIRGTTVTNRPTAISTSRPRGPAFERTSAVVRGERPPRG